MPWPIIHFDRPYLVQFGTTYIPDKDEVYVEVKILSHVGQNMTVLLDDGTVRDGNGDGDGDGNDEAS